MSGMSLSAIGTLLNTASNTMESNLQTNLTALAAKTDPSTADMLVMQQALQQWTLMVQTQSTVVKELGDALKGIVQKAG